MANKRWVVRATMLAAIMALSATAAQAARTLSFSYRTTDGGPAVAAAGTLTIGDTPIFGSVYQILAIDGTRNGVAIDSLNRTGGGFDWLYLGGFGYLDSYGFDYLIDGVSYNISASTGQLFERIGPDGAPRPVTDFAPVTAFAREELAASPVPEPAGWVLMIGGLMIAGTMVRRQRPVTAAA